MVQILLGLGGRSGSSKMAEATRRLQLYNDQGMCIYRLPFLAFFTSV